MKVIRAYAVVCARGEIHSNDDHSFLFLDYGQAVDAVKGYEWDEGCADESCAPHEVIELEGVAPVPAKPKRRKPR